MKVKLNMLRIRSPRLFAIGLPLLLALFAANHLEYAHRRKAIAEKAKEQNRVVVRAADGAAGHNTIAIDESSVASSGDSIFLHFATLGSWAFDSRTSTPCPASVQALSGQTVSCAGFMYPLTPGERIKVFCLLRSTQTCCYGPRPQYSQYLFVEMPEPVRFERLKPVFVKGKFIVDPQPDQGFIYRLEGTSLSPVGAEETDIDPAKAAQEAHLQRFDFTRLAALGKNQGKGLPPELIALDGKQVVLDGYLVGRSKDAPPHILVSDQWWDGVSQGAPPTLFSAVMVFPKDASQAPPLWKQKDVFTGVLRVAGDSAEWPKNGVVSLHDAVIGVSGVAGVNSIKDAGPALTAFDELIGLLIFLLLTLGLRRTPSNEAPLSGPASSELESGGTKS